MEHDVYFYAVHRLMHLRWLRRFHAVPGAGHNDTVFRGGHEYWRAWRDLVAALPES